MSDNTNIAISYGGEQPSNTSALDAIYAARGGRQGGTPVVVSFTAQPVVNPSSGTAGQTFTATPGTVSNGSITSREWRLAGNVVSTALTYVSTAAGALTYQEFAGSVASNLVAVTVVAAVPALMSGFAWRSNAKSISSTQGSAIPLPVVTGGSNITPTSGSATYVANAVNNVPGIRFPGTAVYEVQRAANAPFYAGQDGQNWTGYISFTGALDQEALNCFLQINGDLNSIRLNRNDGNDPGFGLNRGDTPLLGGLYDSGPHVLGIQSRTASISAPNGGQTGTGSTIVTLDGVPFIMYVGAIPKPGNKDGTGNSFIGAFFNGIYGANVTLVDFVIYNANHTLGQMYDNTKALRYDMGLGMPTKVLMVVGSSLVTAVSADASLYGVVGELRYQNNLAPGSVGLWALGGVNFAGMSEMGAELDGLLSRIGAANLYMIASEGYNALLGSTTAAQAAASFVSYINARVAAGWLPGNIFLDTITGATSARDGYLKYGDFATAVKAIPGSNAGLSAVRVINTAGNYSDNDALIGVGNTTLVADGVHLTGKKGFPGVVSGYPRRASAVYKAPVVALGLG